MTNRGKTEKHVKNKTITE